MAQSSFSDFLKARVRTISGWPKAGVNFRDVTTLFHDPEAFRVMVEAFALDCTQQRIDLIAAVDARGFIVGGALAYQLHKPFVLVRKKGKLPHKTISADYALEYGTATVEIHADACKPGDRILILDDLIATGGTLLAATDLFRRWRSRGRRWYHRSARARGLRQTPRRGPQRPHALRIFRKRITAASSLPLL